MARINLCIIKRNITGCATDEEQTILHQWLTRDEANRDVYSLMKNIWDSCRIKCYSQDDIRSEWERFLKRINAKTAQSNPIPRFRKPKPHHDITMSYMNTDAITL